MVRRMFCLFVGCAVVSAIAFPAWSQQDGAAKKNTVYPIAVLPFQERGAEVKDLGGQVTDLVFANLVSNPELYLVDREGLAKILSELELGESGLVNPGEATQLGQLTGAKVLVTGSVLQVGESLYLVAKVIGTESTRVLGASVKGKLNDELDDLAAALAKNVANTVLERAGDLVPDRAEREDYIAALNKAMKKGGRPLLSIEVAERHVGAIAVDPAAETELTLLAKATGFEIVDADAGDEKEADVALVGEGFSQFAARHGNLVSVSARVEVKAIERKTGRVLAVDRQTVVGAGLAEQIAAKSALEDAAAKIAARLLPKISNAPNPKKK